MAKGNKTGGKPPFVPTADQKAIVRALKAYGAPDDDVCEFIVNRATGKPINRKTLNRVFKQEIKLGRWQAVREVADTLKRSALGTPAEFNKDGKQTRAERAPDTTAAIFFLKAVGGWRDRSDVYHQAAAAKAGQGTPGRQPIIFLASDAKL